MIYSHTDQNGFLVFRPRKDTLDEAYAEYERDFSKSNRLNSKTVYNRKGSRLAGILGEIAFKKYAIGSVRHKNLAYDFTFNGKTVDVKTKYRTVSPRGNFEASIFPYQEGNYFKAIDYYAFLSVIEDLSTIWFCGLSTKENWLTSPKRVLWKKGETDPTNGKTFEVDTWSIFYKDLTPFMTNPYACIK